MTSTADHWGAGVSASCRHPQAKSLSQLLLGPPARRLCNVTIRCNVTVMDNVTGKCSECGNDMYGRADRKFCSAACRQRSYRQKRNVTVSSNVTAEPFLLNYEPAFYKDGDDFWQMVHVLPDSLGTLSMHDAGADYEQYGFDEQPAIMAYPPRTKVRAERDLETGLDGLRNFLDSYDEIAANLLRMRATAEAILKYHEGNAAD